MSEYGKLIKLEFDGDIKESSLSSNGFQITADEYDYVPGGNANSAEYTIEDIGYNQARITKEGFDSGEITDIENYNGTIKLEAVLSEEGVGPTDYSGGGFHGNQYGINFTVTAPVTLKSARSYVSSVGTYTMQVYRIVSSLWSQYDEFSYTSDAAGWVAFDIDVDITEPGDYWVGFNTTHLNVVRGEDIGWPQSSSGGEIAFTGGCIVNGTPNTVLTNWYYLYDIKVLIPSGYNSTGSWKHVLPLSAIDNAQSGNITWSEDLPTDTVISAYYAITDSGTVEPSSWSELLSSAEILSEGIDYSDKYLWLKFVLDTSDSSVSPTASDLLVRLYNEPNKKELIILIYGVNGINNAIDSLVHVQYTSANGTLAGYSSGAPAVEDFTEIFTAINLVPKNNPNHENSVNLTTVGLIQEINNAVFIGHEQMQEEVSLAQLSATAVITHVDDIPV